MILSNETKARLSYFEDALLEEVEKSGTLKKLEPGEELMRPGMYVTYIPIIVTGSLKIIRQDADGKESFLYYLTNGNTCAISLTCCTGHRVSLVRAVAEEPTEMVLIPVEKIPEWLNRFPTWRTFVFQTYQSRFEDLLDAVDSLAFKKMDERLWRLLQKKASLHEKHYVYVTHQKLADELSTSREVITRLLKKLEGLGKIKTYRNRIEILQEKRIETKKKR